MSSEAGLRSSSWMASSRDWWRDPSSRIRASNAMTDSLLAVGGRSEPPLARAVRSHMFAAAACDHCGRGPLGDPLHMAKPEPPEPPRLIVGISGASGVVYGLRA